MLRIDPSARHFAFRRHRGFGTRQRIQIGANVVIDAFVKIKPAGGMGVLRIGEDTVINSGCVLYTGNGLRIGRGVAIAANCTFAPVDHEFQRKDVPIAKQGF